MLIDQQFLSIAFEPVFRDIKKNSADIPNHLIRKDT